MPRLLAVALFLAPSAALATPLVTMTGKVSVVQPACFRAPCPEQVRIVHEDGSSYEISGEMRADLEAYDGKTVTIKSNDVDGTLEVFGFAPGTSADFVTGRLSLESPNCPPNARCAPNAYITENGRKILVPAPESFELHSVDGALVTLRGFLDSTGEELTLRRKPNTNVLVRGLLEKLPRGMNGQTHTLTFENGQSILVSGRRWADRNGKTVWLNAKISFERISGQPMLVSNIASRPVVPEAPVELPFGAGAGEGTNVARDSQTNGAGSSKPSGTTTSSAGTSR